MLAGVAAAIAVGGGGAKADFVFGEPSKVPNMNTSSADVGSISPDGLELYIASSHPYGGDECYCDIYLATRPTVDDAWGTLTKLGPPVNSDGADNHPRISADGLELYFNDGFFSTLASGCTYKANGYGKGDLWVSTRPTRDDPWGDPENLGPNVNDSYYDSGPSISSDGLSLYFHSYGRAGSHGLFDLYVTKRPTRDDPWGPAENLGPLINSSTQEQFPVISPDDLSLYFSSGNTTFDIYVSRRSSAAAPWEAPVPFEPVNSSLSEYSLTFASGDSALYFNRGINWNPPNTGPIIAASNDVWQVEVTPIVDLNSDGFVDAADMCIIVDNWHTENSLCDVAPAPMGDGFVDVQDLVVVAEHLFEPFPPVAPVEVNENDDGRVVVLKRGQRLFVTLESNPSTGYRWERVEDPASIVDQVGEVEFRPSETGEPPIVGAGGWEIFQFKAISSGQMTLQLVYHRPWEEGVEPIKTFSLQVIVP
jgi:predicted secreted protein